MKRLLGPDGATGTTCVFPISASARALVRLRPFLGGVCGRPPGALALDLDPIPGLAASPPPRPSPIEGEGMIDRRLIRLNQSARRYFERLPYSEKPPAAAPHDKRAVSKGADTEKPHFLTPRL